MSFSDKYLGELLRRYQANFDITENFKLGDRIYPAYAWFYSLSEKYVLKKEAKLWAIKAYEHVLFIKEDQFDLQKLSELMDVITRQAEPVLVRKNDKYPEKDHMCSYITFVVMTSNDLDVNTIKAVQKFHYDKGYLFNFRGHSEARLAVISIESGKVVTNHSGKDMKALLEDAYAKTGSAGTSQTEAAADDSYEYVS
ncbi:hypothetical protein [Butyrivibrio sp. AC2005]|uniref:hypothetical protein n=1 Tax=Butyrivibrio sp. AC2005 TaxID=1280672 RepID=UPI0003FB3FF3|nr:hypothetical protein [Butyrivibrio sp. AC2005]